MSLLHSGKRRSAGKGYAGRESDDEARRRRAGTPDVTRAALAAVRNPGPLRFTCETRGYVGTEMSAPESGPRGGFRLAWLVLTLISVALVVGGIGLFYLPGTPARLAGVAVSSIGLFSLFITWYGVRDQSRFAIRTMWTLPVALTGAALTFLLGERPLLTLAFAGAAGLAAAMLLLARNRLP